MNIIKGTSLLIAIVVLVCGLWILIGEGTGIWRITGWLVKEQKAVEAINNLGFTEVKVIDRSVSFVGLRGGGEGDKVRFTVRGKNPTGKETIVYVFAGWPFKGATVRSL